MLSTLIVRNRAINGSGLIITLLYWQSWDYLKATTEIRISSENSSVDTGQPLFFIVHQNVISESEIRIYLPLYGRRETE